MIHGHARRGRLTPEYVAWRSMIARCENPKNKSFVDYGGRGISVTAAWHSFAVFVAAVGPRPSAKHSIDRLDNDKGYEPGNVRWATRLEQNTNKRNVHLLAARGKSQTISQWAKEIGVSGKTILTRLRADWPIERAIFEPINTSKRNGRAI